MKSVLAVAAVLVFASSAFGSVISVTASSVAPTTDLVQWSDTESANAAAGVVRTADAAGTHYYSGQTWSNPTDFVIDKITYQIGSGAAALSGKQVIVELWATSIGQGFGTVPLQTDTATLPTGLVNGDYVTFDISNYNAVGNSNYALLVDFASADAGNIAGWAGNSASATYANGGIINFEPQNNNDWDAVADDMDFFVQTVPEPATMSLLALGALGALIRRKK